MSCYRPLDGFRTEGGSVVIGHEPPGSVEKLRVPCGRCFGCRMEYAESWATRLQHEASCWDSNLFVTLTYEDKNLQWHKGLVLDDLQLFMKRLRKSHQGLVTAPDGRRPIRFFAAGEYGSRTDRPHWHLALFNCGLRLRQEMSPDLEKLWPHGLHTVTPFTVGRASYIAGYATKKVHGRMARQERYSVVNPETGELVERRPEFVVMSRRPGIGAFFYHRHKGDLERGF